MRSIDSIKADIEHLQSERVAEMLPLENELQAAYDVLFSDLPWIEEAYTRLESSNDYMTDQFDGWPCQWTRVEQLADIEENARDNFRDYIDNKYGAVTIDWTNDVFVMNNGPAIIINDEGDVLDQDSGKWIIKKNDYLVGNDDTGEAYYCKLTRNELIEKYMEKQGYFPGVFNMDRYGNVYPISTTKEKGE